MKHYDGSQYSSKQLEHANVLHGAACTGRCGRAVLGGAYIMCVLVLLYQVAGMVNTWMGRYHT